MTNETQILLELLLDIIVMIFLVMKTKTHTFIALLLATLITGIVGHMSPSEAINAIQNGFGSTLKSTGIIIGLGVMMGGILEKTGATERLAYAFIRLIGKGKEEWALGITGWLVSIPVLTDSAIVTFTPLCKAISKVIGKSVVGLALALACSLRCTHIVVPPTPGPLTAARMMGVDVGQMVLAESGMSILIFVVAVLYAKWVGRNTCQISHEDGTFERIEYRKEYLKTTGQLKGIMSAREFPGLVPSLASILIPLVLILSKTIANFAGIPEGTAYTIISLLGSPIVALGIGTILAVYSLGVKIDKKKLLGVMNDNIRGTGTIMLITGVGSSLGSVIKVSGISDVLGVTVVSWPILATLIPLTIDVLMCLAPGSATVAITTAASLAAPLVNVLGVNPILLAQSCCIGTIALSYFSGSEFWISNGVFGLIDLKDQLRCRTAVSMIMTGVGITELLVLNMVM